jgi:hypothetical protein
LLQPFNNIKSGDSAMRKLKKSELKKVYGAGNHDTGGSGLESGVDTGGSGVPSDDESLSVEEGGESS